MSKQRKHHPKTSSQSKSQRLVFKITLQEPVILNDTSATAGVPGCLDFIPGSALLGIAANRAYTGTKTEAITESEGWHLFQSGQVRFSDALPLVDNETLYPMPLSFHQKKGSDPKGLQKYSAYNCTPIQIPAFTQDGAVTFTDLSGKEVPVQELQQIRKGYISEKGVSFSPSQKQQMKTAIDPRTGRAKEQQLFSLQTLQAGQRFIFSVELDNPLPELEKWQKQLGLWLAGEARIGRSRTAEFGKVSIELISDRSGSSSRSNSSSKPKSSSSAIDIRPQELESQENLTLTLWLLSDLCLINDLGQPCLDPQAKYLGLPEGSHFLPEESYYRNRSYSPFNGKRRCRDPERHVISRGSVLKYKLREPLTDDARNQLQQVGLFQASGLGRIAVNPEYLTQEVVTLTPWKDDEKSPRMLAGVKATATPLTRLLQKRAGTNSQQQEANALARKLLNELTQALLSARSWQGLKDRQSLPGAPGRSQWGQIKEACNRYRKEPDQLLRMLFTKSDEAIVRDRSGWQLETGPSSALYGVFENAKTLKELQADNKALIPEVIGRTAVLALDGHWMPYVDGSFSYVQGGSHAS